MLIHVLTEEVGTLKVSSFSGSAYFPVLALNFLCNFSGVLCPAYQKDISDCRVNAYTFAIIIRGFCFTFSTHAKLKVQVEKVHMM